MTTPTSIKCPHCLQTIDLVQHVQEQSWRELYRHLGGLGDSWGRAFAYLQLCRKSESGRAPVKTMIKMAIELNTIWQAGRFFYSGAEHRIDRAQLVAGMEACIEKNLNGLKNNNYLKQILLGKARESRRDEGKQEAGHYKRQAERASTRPADEPRDMRGETVTEQAPAKMILSLVTAYKSKTARNMFPTLVAKMETKLAAAGVDLAKLEKLAPDLPESPDGPELLSKCQAKGGEYGKNN